jgi:putative oxidoreductase
VLMKRNPIIDIICSCLIFLWTYAALSKWLQFKVFITSLYNQPLPLWSVYPLSYALPAVELFIALALGLNHYRKMGLWCSLMLLSVFTLYIGATLLNFFSRVPCSCGGLISSLTWKEHLWFNFLFLVLSILGLTLMRARGNSLKQFKNLTI